MHLWITYQLLTFYCYIIMIIISWKYKGFFLLTITAWQIVIEANQWHLPWELEGRVPRQWYMEMLLEQSKSRTKIKQDHFLCALFLNLTSDMKMKAWKELETNIVQIEMKGCLLTGFWEILFELSMVELPWACYERVLDGNNMAMLLRFGGWDSEKRHVKIWSRTREMLLERKQWEGKNVLSNHW